MSRPFALTTQRGSPEALIQKRVVAMLRAYMPDEVFWTASLSGVRLAPAVAAQAKAAGMNRGAPDLSFVWPDGLTTYLEIKAPGGELTPEQARLARTLVNRMRVCRSWEQARAALEVWMAPYGLRFLTDTESFRREAQRRAA